MKRVLMLAVIAACGGGKSTSEPTTVESSEQAAQPQPPPAEPAGGSAAGCNADASKDAGMAHIERGEHAEALASFESALACADDPYLRQLAFMESCASGNAEKARHYYKQLTPAQQEKFSQICNRQKPPVPYQ